MKSLYEITREINAASSMEEAKDILYGSGSFSSDLLARFKLISAAFVRKKDSIIVEQVQEKLDATGTPIVDATGKKLLDSTLIFDLNNQNDLWSILFLAEYINEYIDRIVNPLKSQRSELSKELRELNKSFEKKLIAISDIKEYNESEVSIEIKQKKGKDKLFVNNNEVILNNNNLVRVLTRDGKEKMFFLVAGNVSEIQPDKVEILPDDEKREKRKQLALIGQKKSELSSKIEKIQGVLNKYDNPQLKTAFFDPYSIDFIRTIVLKNANVSSISQLAIYERIKRAIKAVHVTRNCFEHAPRYKNKNIIINNYDVEIEIPPLYLQGFYEGRIVVEEKDKEIAQRVNEIFKQLGFDTRRVNNFFYNVDPANLYFLLSVCKDQDNDIYKFPSDVFVNIDKYEAIIKALVNLNRTNMLNNSDFELLNKIPQEINSHYIDSITNIILNNKNYNLDKNDIPFVTNIISLKQLESNGNLSKDEIDNIINYFKSFKIKYKTELGNMDISNISPLVFYGGLDEKTIKEIIQMKRIILSDNNKYKDDLSLLFDNFVSDKQLHIFISDLIVRFNEISQNEPNKDPYKCLDFIIQKINLMQKDRKTDINNPNNLRDLYDTEKDIIRDVIKRDVDLNAYYASEDSPSIQPSSNLNKIDDGLIELLKNSKKNNISIKSLLKSYYLNNTNNNDEIYFGLLKISNLESEYNFLLEETMRTDFLRMIQTNYRKLSSLESLANVDETSKASLVEFYDKIISKINESPLNQNEICALIKSEVTSLRGKAFYINNISEKGFTSDLLKIATIIENKEANFELCAKVIMEINDCMVNQMYYSDKPNSIASKNIKNMRANFSKNIKKILQSNNYEDDLLKVPSELFFCDECMFEELSQKNEEGNKKYNEHIIKSIFGTDNPKIISSVIYANSVFTNFDKTSTDYFNMKDYIDFDSFLSNAEADTLASINNILVTNPSFGSSDVKNQLYIDPTTSKEEAMKNLINKFRNSMAHFSFKPVYDNNGNVVSDKIHLYDKYAEVTEHNFDIIINLDDFIEFTRICELYFSKKNAITQQLPTNEPNKFRKM